MVVIRLSRGGTNKRPFYNVVVTDQRKPRDSGYIERLGFYNPIATGGETKLSLNLERIAHWIACGATPSARVQHLLDLNKKMGTEGGSETRTKRKAKKAKANKKTEVAIESVIANPENATDATNPETEV